MSFTSAVIRIDHRRAQIIDFDRDSHAVRSVAAHVHHTRQHHSEVRTGHEFFAQVCDALGAATQILVTGPHTGLSAFRHYVEKHRPAMAGRIAGWEAVDHPSEGQLLAHGRKYLAAHARMAEPAA